MGMVETAEQFAERLNYYTPETGTWHDGATRLIREHDLAVAPRGRRDDGRRGGAPRDPRLDRRRSGVEAVLVPVV